MKGLHDRMAYAQKEDPLAMSSLHGADGTITPSIVDHKWHVTSLVHHLWHWIEEHTVLAALRWAG